MRRRATSVLAATALALLALATPAAADFGLSQFEVRFTEEDGTPTTQAGAHPFAMDTFLEFNYSEQGGKILPDGGDIRTTLLEQMKGFVGSATAVATCSTLDFVTEKAVSQPNCSNDTAVGVIAALLGTPVDTAPAAVYNLTPPPGVPARLGFMVSDVPVVIDVGVKPQADHNILARIDNTPQPLTVFGAVTQLWGVPADPAHDFARGECSGTAFAPGQRIIAGHLNLKEGAEREASPLCATETEEEPFLTVPRACQGPLASSFELESWSGGIAKGAHQTPAFQGCSKLEFLPGISSKATADSAETGSGLDFELDFEDEVDDAGEGLVEPDGIAQSDLKKAVVTLPRGVTVNPSIAEGLGVCTPADLNRETIAAEAGAGCPNASKIGTVSVQTPLLAEEVQGSVFLAPQDDPATPQPGAENPFDSLIAFYIVLKSKQLGVLVEVPAKVEPDPVTGQLVTTVDDAPQIPFSRFEFHFREGQRAPLITPSTCGTHTTTTAFTPWARPTETVTKSASFQITSGVGGGPCPAGGVPPFEPGFEAGSANNNAASYSPFLMRLTRRDGDQDLTKFSATLPPGVLGKLVGVGRCPEGAIEAAKAKSGRQEIAAPSCPAASLIGRTEAGAGVGSALTYVPGSLHLAGPYKGAPLSVASITPAVAGPFDAGTVVVRVGLDLNPRSGEVIVDGAASDPIPHILEGIVLKVRDLRVATDRAEFTLNPTSCEEEATRASIFGGFLDVFSAADDVPVARSARYQAANCAALGFKPRLELALRGGTRRGAHPALRAVLRPRPGDANLEGTVVRLPRSAFLDQGHIRTICTRVQFAQQACPAGAIYGHVRAFTPLLSEPLEGPAYLRSSDNKLPDLVFDLKGIVDVEASARIDSVKGAIRASFDSVPDAPVSKVIVNMQGGDKGLIVNSRNLCAAPSRAAVRLDAHNGARVSLRPKLRTKCKGKRREAKRSPRR